MSRAPIGPSESSTTTTRELPALSIVNTWDNLFARWRARRWIQCTKTEAVTSISCGFCSYTLLENLKPNWNQDRAAAISQLCPTSTFSATASQSSAEHDSTITTAPHHWHSCSFGGLGVLQALAKRQEICTAISQLPDARPIGCGVHLRYLGPKGEPESLGRKTRSATKPSPSLPQASDSTAASRRIDSQGQGLPAPTRPVTPTPPYSVEIALASTSHTRKRKSPPACSSSSARDRNIGQGSICPPKRPRLPANNPCSAPYPEVTPPNLRRQGFGTSRSAATAPNVSTDAPNAIARRPQSANRSGPLPPSPQVHRPSPILIDPESSPDPETPWATDFFDEIRDGIGRPMNLGNLIGPACESDGVTSAAELCLFSPSLFLDYLAQKVPSGLAICDYPFIEKHVEDLLKDQPSPADGIAKFLDGLLSGLGQDDVVQLLTKHGLQDEKRFIGYTKFAWRRLTDWRVWQTDTLPPYKKWILQTVIAEYLP